MPTILQILVDALHRLAGPGALTNAADEVDRATRSVVDLERFLGRLAGPDPRRAA